jgi:hypothetical protein
VSEESLKISEDSAAEAEQKSQEEQKNIQNTNLRENIQNNRFRSQYLQFSGKTVL